jgi:hypothetical protein
MAKVGRPTSYKPEMCEQVFEMALLGLTDVQMAKVLGVAESTFNLFKEIPEFSEALTQGKEDADAKVAKAMYKRALGLTITEDALTRDGEVVQLKKELPPDTAAAKHWLANRQRALWANNGETTINSDQPIIITLTEKGDA